MATIKLPTPLEPLVDSQTGNINEVWYRFFSESAIQTNSVSSALASITTASTITLTFAAQADQEATTATAAIVTPSVQQYHPSAAKAWGKVTVAGTVGTLNAGYNVASVLWSSLGSLGVNLTVPFSSSHYVVIPAALTDSAGEIVNISTVVAVTSFRLLTASTDPLGIMFACYGDQ